MSKPGIFATIPVADLEADAAHAALNRSLGPVALTALGIGGIIGTGIFVLTGIAAAEHAGPAVVLSFIIAGFGCIFAGLCYAEFASMVPVAGSAYAYSYATLGEFTAWFVGWNLVLEYLFAAATVAVGWSRYCVSLLNYFHVNFVPAVLSASPWKVATDGVTVLKSGAMLNVPAIFVALLVTWICYIGIRQSAFVNTLVVIIKVAIVLVVIGFGAFYVNPANWHPFIPPNTGTFGVYGWSGVLRAAGVVFFAYIGFDAVSTAAQEAKNPARNMPIGILGSLLICTVLYILMSAVLTGLLPFALLNDAAPVAVALAAHAQLAWLVPWVTIGALAGLTSVILVMMLAQARIFLAMARHGLLWQFFGKVHPKFRTPHIATLITGLFAATVGGLVPVDILGELVSIGTLFAFIVVCIGVLVLRKTRPDLPRPFRVKAVWFVAPAGVVMCALMIGFLPVSTWLRLVLWTAIGILIYFTYGYQHSRLRNRAISVPASDLPA
ncbi:MAG TPA: amino acid permease [Steroidobacteraceae bacterium]|nr:amino acid permease [Steroidobacteraceae bacterium]